MTARQQIKWSVFDLITLQAAYQPKAILETYDMNKIICQSAREHTYFSRCPKCSPLQILDQLSVFVYFRALCVTLQLYALSLESLAGTMAPKANVCPNKSKINAIGLPMAPKGLPRASKAFPGPKTLLFKILPRAQMAK